MTTMLKTKQKRVPNEQRSKSMRMRLLDATIETIAAEGLANAKTSQISKRAKVSRGAQTHHFPKRNDLMLSAVRENSKRYRDYFEHATPALAENEDPVRSYLNLLWDACFEEIFVESWMEIMTAARTDRELLTAVRKMDSAAMEFMRELSLTLARNENAPDIGLDVIELSVTLLRGMVIQNGVHKNSDHLRSLFDLWLSIVSQTLNLANEFE